ncbi:DUF4062 domain-containing protein [Planomonospora sp. ID82291]|uniref:DUF4062 domain-containing protein n=1 Tax=Planomonospora sp. ID82291 TaxID=2738136 RepID=UPI0018C353C5|nr:DUF4062 domain-containing protein [Planomonospora sp. ID82291]MBG0817578.1 DUF4062 domain-containing protein [Planomonospora sp. ID82291]
MAKVYVSSTFQDLAECRERVRVTLRQMGHTDVAMEYYVAENVRPLDRCLADVAACDLYICIVALRYGFVPEGRDRSITELEFLRAQELGKPILAFVLKEGATWDTGQIEFSAHSRVQSLRERLRADFLTAEFTDANDLSAELAAAVHRWGREQEEARPGHLANWGAYRVAVTDRHRLVRLQVIMGARQDRAIEIPLNDVFVSQPCRSGRPDYDLFQDDGTDPDSGDLAGGPPLAPAADGSAAAVLGREDRQVVLGGPGSGKSTLLLSRMLRLCEDPEAPVPILVELRQYALDPSRNLLDYMADTLKRDHLMDLDAAGLKDLLAHGESAVLFDGLDEVLGPNDRARITGEVRAFAEAFPQAAVVVTSRLAGYDGTELDQAGFTHYTLLDFGMPEIKSFVPKWYEFYTLQGDERDAHSLVHRISESARLRELAGNPLLLTMMAVIYKHSDLPERRWQLYGKCTEVLLEDWDVKRKKIGREELLSFVMTAEQKAHLLQRVAIAMLHGARPGRELNAIARGSLIEIVSGYLQEAYRRSPGEARGIAEEIIDHLRERTYVLAEIGENVFGFVHRTFMEFFAAGHVLAEFNARESDFGWLTEEVFGAHWSSDDWREVLLLLAAMLKGQGSPIRKVIEHVEHLTPRPSSVTPGFHQDAVAFAARLLGEAGAEPWAQGLVDKVVGFVHVLAPQGRTPTRDASITGFLSALFLIGDAVPPSSRVLGLAAELSHHREFRVRLIAFQLEVALRGRGDRLAFALASLRGDEAASRGAIAVLEREWPGNEHVGFTLLALFDSERHTRIRADALRALVRSWSLDDALLHALTARVGRERQNIAEIAVPYLCDRWAGDRHALCLAIRFAASKVFPGSRNLDLDYFRIAVFLITRSWNDPVQLGLAAERIDGALDPSGRLLAHAIMAGVRGIWQSPTAAADRLFEEAVRLLPAQASLRLTMNSLIVNSLDDGPHSSPHDNPYGWLMSLATRTQDLETYTACCDVLADFPPWHAHEVKQVILRRINDDLGGPDPAVIARALLKTGTTPDELVPFLESGHPGYRIAWLYVQAFRYFPEDQIKSDAVSIHFPQEGVVRLISERIRLPRPDEETVRLATEDPDWRVRACALSLLAASGVHPDELTRLVAAAVDLQGAPYEPVWANYVLRRFGSRHAVES